MKIYRIIAAALCLMGADAAFISCAQDKGTPKEETLIREVMQVHNLPPRAPEFVAFAGDTVRFDTMDMYERMDREMIAFTYMHSTSLLMLKRAGRYFPVIEPILKANGIPDDLKYLMVIESNLDPKAVSSAGAAGLWQFTKATAKTFGLEVREGVDERYNIEKETIAACKYLKQAYAKYHDWMTVAASYNAGMGGISKKLEEQKQKSAMKLWLVEETSRYMYRILACKTMFEDPAAFGFDFSDGDRYQYVKPAKVVKVKAPIASLVDFATEHGVTYAELKAANLWLRDNRLDNKENREYSIIIPARIGR